MVARRQNYLFSWSLLLAAVIAPALGCGIDRQDYTYNDIWKGFYKLHSSRMSWDEARLTCEQENAVLATPYTFKQRAEMLHLIDGRALDCGIFIGVRESQQSKGEYLSVEGTPLCLIPHQWASNEPNSIMDSCLVLLPDGTLADEPCTETVPFVCYKKHKRCNVCRNPCNTKDSAYKFEQRTSSCYKFHSSPRTWGEAVKVCSDEGGHLTIINSEVESTVLKELFAEHPPETLPGTTHHTVVHIGFHNVFLRHNWLNVDGTNLTVAGFNTWSPGQPDNAGSNEHCGSIFRNGLLNDLPCGARDAFICEIDATSDA